MCNEDGYKTQVFAYLTRLKYLDYELIEQADFSKARDSKLELVVDMEAKEEAKKKKEELKKKEFDKAQTMSKANLAGMDFLFDTLLKDDQETSRTSAVLSQTPGSDVLYGDYRAKLEAATSACIAAVLKTFVMKEEEKSLFKTVAEKATKENEMKSIELIQKFEARKKKRILSVQGYDHSRRPKTFHSGKCESASAEALGRTNGFRDAHG